ncbi:rho GDP-dissociation inhibitor 1 [Elysia marginata]|uniref:Rho GDP-dissociation inhibitor 3 n=1 Tax=Elysia marginata TaxID=1093978 RepID=A0AAV4JLV6_9GAST|nr:rho GDP-dissociation inhibitor 1 [Elysia marginata]
MAEQEHEQEQAAKDVEEVDEEDNPNYKPPAPKALNEIVEQDQDDESLVKYKQTLLGGGSNNIVIDTDKMNCIIQKLSLLVEGRDEVSIDLTKPEDEIKKECFSIKEGCKYQLKIYFYVQRDIVPGLKYHHTVYRKGIRVDSMSQMVGSYGPKAELQSFTSPPEDAPSGMLMRGDYKIKSKFYDDDKNVYASWEWHLAVKKDW